MYSFKNYCPKSSACYEYIENINMFIKVYRYIKCAKDRKCLKDLARVNNLRKKKSEKNKN